MERFREKARDFDGMTVEQLLVHLHSFEGDAKITYEEKTQEIVITEERRSSS
jgi:hypothetical protein